MGKNTTGTSEFDTGIRGKEASSIYQGFILTAGVVSEMELCRKT